jgi:protein archease
MYVGSSAGGRIRTRRSGDALRVHRFVEHTGELELELEADSEEGVFEEALLALGELLAEHEPEDGREPTRADAAVDVHAPDQATLLAEWLGELAFLAEAKGFVPERASRLELGEQDLHAVVEGHRGAPPHLVKAVTYHRLEFERAGEVWRARVVLDV